MKTRPRLLVATLLAALLAVGAALVASAGPAAAVSLPGMVLSSTTATLPPELAPLATGKRIQYLTTDVNGNLIMATGLIMTPTSYRQNKIVAWAHGSTGLADQCAGMNQSLSHHAIKRGRNLQIGQHVSLCLHS